MLGQRPKFIKPGDDDSLYPTRNKDGVIETLVNPNTDSAITTDKDACTSFVYNRYHHLPLETQRQRLPVFEYRNQILYLLERFQTLVLIGETGCGKSTQVPQYLNEIGHTVCVTQPRVSACVSLACRVAEERGEHVGERVGYACGATAVRSPSTGIVSLVCVTQPRVSACVSLACRVAKERGKYVGERVGYACGATAVRSPSTGIVFMTEGVLLREMFASPLLMQYSCIVLDEVHERSQMTDVLMGLLKKIAKKRKNLKLVISSATMDAEFLRDFFNTTDKKDKEKTSTSVIMSMQGRTHPIEVFYAEEPVPDYVKATIDTVISIHENEPFGDVLAFLTSQEEILQALETLRPYADDNNEKNRYRKTFPSGMQASNLLIVPMYGSLPHYKQIQAFRMAERGVRKVVLATNVAETSVTVPGVVYVIDCGFHKVPFFDPAVGVESLCVTPVSKNNATQRAGRAGRTARGKCFRLYTEAEYDKLPPSVPPEICRSDLSSVLLQLKALGIHNLLRFTFPTPPPAKTLLAGLETLYALKAIDKHGDLTPDSGVYMAELPLRPMCARMLCNSGEYGCIDEALSISAMLQVDSPFIKSSSGKENIAARILRRNNFEVAEGDIIMYLNVFDAYTKIKSSQPDEKRSKRASKDWCKKMYINYRVMEKACEIRTSLEKLIKHKFKLEDKTFEGPDLGTEKCIRLMKCILSGWFPQAAYLSTTGAYCGVRGAVLHISPDSCLYRVQQPKWVVYSSVQATGDKTFMRDLLVLEPAWLLDVAPHYYKQT